MKQTRRARHVVEQEALRLARFERSESWQGLSPGDPVRIAGHRGGTWRFRAFVTNTSNGASWVEVSEVMAAGRRRRGSGSSPEDGDDPPATTMTRARSFRPELVSPAKRGRRRSVDQVPGRPPLPPAPGPGPATATATAPLQSSLFDGPQ